MGTPKLSTSIKKYNSIMEDFSDPKSKVTNDDFKKKFNGYYRMGRMAKKGNDYMNKFFIILEKYRSNTDDKNKALITFENVLRELWNETGVFTPSFASKLVATINPDMPIWDTFVKRHCHVSHPAMDDDVNIRIAAAKKGYEKIYNTLRLDSENLLKKFDVMCKNDKDINQQEIDKISEMKRIDFVIWLNRQRIK